MPKDHRRCVIQLLTAYRDQRATYTAVSNSKRTVIAFRNNGNKLRVWNAFCRPTRSYSKLLRLQKTGRSQLPTTSQSMLENSWFPASNSVCYERNLYLFNYSRLTSSSIDSNDKNEETESDETDSDTDEQEEDDDYEIDDTELLRMWKNDKELMIAKQKERAIAHWQEAVKTNDKLLKMNASIVEHLNKGLVPPAFHAFSANETDYLFPVGTRVSIDDTNSDEIKLSANPVTAGKSFTGKKLKSQISLEEEMSYLLYFFDEKSGKALPTVRDSKFVETWEFSTKYTQTVTDLVNTPATMVGEDVEVTKLTKLFPGIKSAKVGTTDVKNLITRSLSRGVVADCFNNSEPESTYAIVGNPGIGKSWTLLYALQQALLYENACVIFFLQKSGDAILCIRRNNTIFVWRIETESCRSSFFRNSNVLVLVDPPNDGERTVFGQRRLIFAASNNKRHFKGEIHKETPLFARTLSPYTDKELVVAIPHMLPENCDDILATMKKMLHRRTFVGNLPRYLLNDKHFFGRERGTIRAVEQTKEDNLQHLFKYFDGISDYQSNNLETIQEYLFSVWAKVDHTKDKECKGYDGQKHIKYEESHIKLMSTYVKEIIMSNYREFILTYFGKVSSSDMSAMGMKLEELFWIDLKARRKMRIFKLIRGTKLSVQSLLPLSQNKSFVYTYAQNCTFEDLKELIFPNNNVICQMKSNTATIDFAGPGRKVYQVTVSRKKSKKSLLGLEELFLASGHLLKGHEENLSVSTQKLPNIDLYWVVPHSIESEWKKRAPMTLAKTKNDPNRAAIKEVLDNHVIQHVLSVDTDTSFAEKTELGGGKKKSRKNRIGGRKKKTPRKKKSTKRTIIY